MPIRRQKEAAGATHQVNAGGQERENLVSSLAQPMSLDEQIAARQESAFNRRAVELAEAAHLTGTPHILELRQHTILFTVPSRDRRREYRVVADKAATSCWCECPAGSRSRPCSHAGAVAHYLGVMARACRSYAKYVV